MGQCCSGECAKKLYTYVPANMKSQARMGARKQGRAGMQYAGTKIKDKWNAKDDKPESGEEQQENKEHHE